MTETREQMEARHAAEPMTGPGNVAVTQADREAAAKCHEKSCYEIVRIQGVQCRNGYADGDYLVQAFARHRQSHTDLLAAAREALQRIACFDDEGAEAWLRKHGSYGGFDEPGSVEIARTTLASIDAALGKQDTGE